MAANTKAYAKVVENGVQAVEAVKELRNTGYSYEDVYVLAHSTDRTDKIAETADAKEIGRKEEGMFDSLANLFRSRGDELRAKIQSMGFTEAEADFYEKELDQGKILVIANKLT
ncbi:general stress protein [Paenibacillus sp. JX-17]|uniref:General stress protein n=1 Tax=Paenibacillus lacisoli TaxID=3064525 RepID=A0ABT9CJK0_9BACL|nr:general stress protein [Paenibacillus sp. JX-17]MDO7907841.1 general stress protein [Paenibacillus sp. JX-17]